MEFMRKLGKIRKSRRSLMKNRGFSGKMGVSRVYGRKLRFWWKNGGFIEKWGFRGFLVKKSGKSRKEPGI